MKNRILVVCYSRSGTTMRVATHLAKELHADLERIEENGSREGIGGYVRSAFEAAAKGLPSIRTRKDPHDYDLVVIGTPVWMGTMSSPIRSYLFSHAPKIRRAAFFAVMGGRGGDNAVREMELACGISNAPNCVLTQADVEHDRHAPKCRRFIETLEDAVGPTLVTDGDRAR